MKVKLELKKRNREYGIITWPLKLDFEIKTLFNCKTEFSYHFQGKAYSKRKISYKFRRFSFGKQKIASLNKNFVTIRKENNIYLID